MKVPGLAAGNLHDYHWLTSAAAEPYFQRCAEHTGQLTRLVASLRKDLSAERAHLVIEQVALRHRAKEKFARASEMFFTRKGLEQATDEAIAAYKAKYARTITSCVADVCCGIGGDLLALSSVSLLHRRPAVAVDLDPIIAHLAGENHLRILGTPADVLVQDAYDADLKDCGVIHIDPDRRADGQRHVRLQEFSPGLDFLDRHASQTRVVKLAPATRIPESLASQGQCEWIASRGECRQQVLWLGNAPTKASRVATVVNDRGLPLITVNNEFPCVLETASNVERFIYEPNPAVLAAGLVAELACKIAPGTAKSITPDGGYLTSESPAQESDLECFEVVDVLPFDMRRLKSYFRERRVGRLEIKKRGVENTPEQIRKQLAPQGEASATLIVARRSAGQVIAIVAQRV